MSCLHRTSATLRSPAARWHHNRTAKQARRRSGPVLVRAELSELNPQNVPNPKVLPSPDFSAEQAVRVQLEALKKNDQPWAHHGLQTMYEFAADVGGLDPSLYFDGKPRDLYHYDHYMGKFQNLLGELVNCSSYSIEGVVEAPSSAATESGAPDAVVRARVTDSTGTQEVVVEFHLTRRQFGSKKGSLMTRMVRKLPSS